jgi:hypothetical protein
MSKWLTFNKLVLNPDKTNIIKLITNKSPQYDLKTGYDEKYIEESTNTKFLDLQIDNHLNWKNYIDLMIPKLSTACYAVISMSHTAALKPSNQFILPVSIMKYGIIFFGGGGVNPPTVK